jgi:hypothetical protein
MQEREHTRKYNAGHFDPTVDKMMVDEEESCKIGQLG